MTPPGMPPPGCGRSPRTEWVSEGYVFGEAKRRAKLFERSGNMVIMDRVDPHAFDGKCEFCGKEEELRPYGPNNESIYAMKDEPTTARKFKEMLDGQQ
jgi:hypothetical protein